MARKGKAAVAPVEEIDEAVAARSPEEEAIQEGREWYVIHTYSGYENKVKTNLEHRITSMDMGDKIYQVLVPTEEEIEIKNGKRHPVERQCHHGHAAAIDTDRHIVERHAAGVADEVLHQVMFDNPRRFLAFEPR